LAKYPQRLAIDIYAFDQAKFTPKIYGPQRHTEECSRLGGLKKRFHVRFIVFHYPRLLIGEGGKMP
jgi:hypothetical protein